MIRFPEQRVLLVSAALLVLSSLADVAGAQYQQGGIFGATSRTSSGMNSLGGSSGSRTGSSFGGGTNPFSNTNANQSVFQQQQSAFGFQNPTNQSGFLGGRNQQTFIGSNQRSNQRSNQLNNQQQQNQYSNRNQGRRNANNPNDLDGMNGWGNQNQSASNQRRAAIRPQQKVAFEFPTRSDTEIRTTLETRFTALSEHPNLHDVNCAVDGDGVAILTGTVATTTAKQLAANVVRLEPGVRRVKNELTVSGK